MGHSARTHISFLLTGLLFLAVPASSFAFGENDKVLHFSISGVFGAASETYLHHNTALDAPRRVAYGALLGIVPGIAKELHDDRQRGESFDWGDMAANASGALCGALLSNYVNDRLQVNVDPARKGVRLTYQLHF